ncbi:MAG: DUF305 domain-containing protein [Alphaproteobacteria bacterium]
MHQLLSIALLVVFGFAGNATAQEHTGHHMPAVEASNPSDAAYAAANAAMHTAMTFPFTGDADRDFLRGMIAHHQGAVDMAQVQLKYGTDVRVKRLAREIIRAQKLEIFWMTKWLNELDTAAKGYTDSDWAGDHEMGGY